MEKIQVPDDMFEKLVAQLKSEGVWEEEETLQSGSEKTTHEESVKKTSQETDSPEQDLERIYSMLPQEDQEALKLGKAVSEKKKRRAIKRKKRMKILRRAGAVAAAFVLVFCLGMTSDANRKLVMKVWDGVAEKFGLHMEIDYADGGNDLLESQIEAEEKAFEEIKEKTGIKKFNFSYLPQGMEYASYEINDKTNEILIYYTYQETIFWLQINRSEKQGMSYNYFDGKFVFKENYINSQNIEMEIWQAKQENDKIVYAATFEHDDYYYICNGEMEYEEFMKILKFLVLD
ncbi:MAG TPA: DUF4367 domain-containing protein [Candidatus Choladousia intestinigallinarum]|nr:DUF4367 domain-containing protein [Candidatus Choladousia intestinigallinarum]